MRTTPAARALAAVLALAMSCGLAPRADAQQAPGQGPDLTTSQAAPQIPQPSGPNTDPGNDTPPAFVKRPARPAAPPRPDLTYAQGKAPVEFRGLPWGTALDRAQAQLTDLTPVTQPVPLKGTYSRAGELLKLGEADIRSVAYYFPKGRLSGVGIVFEGEANYFLIKEHLIRQFGPGRQMGDRYGWTWADFFVEMRMRGALGELRYTHVP